MVLCLDGALERRKMALIYVVEDDKNISEIECFALKNSGYEIEAFQGELKTKLYFSQF